MSPNPLKNSSTATLALWLISAVVIFNIYFTQTSVAQKETLPADLEPVVEKSMIPSLFPADLIAFDPVEFLLDDDCNTERFLQPVIQEASERYKVDHAMIRAIIMAESSYNLMAISEKGAEGLMQLMPKTARELGVTDSFNPIQNIHAGARYFKKLLKRFKGDVRLALAAYNAGSRYVREYKGIPPFKATHAYIKKVLQYQRYYRKQPAGNAILTASITRS
ncbi:MAG: lytic transglycosylase domain-containing protein [Thermodesulfobacteriota bacterium]|nr:lytic transglycosylase domain-containing protein [Thermodesulfobacteriota bacterium]